MKDNDDIVKNLPFYLIVAGFFLVRISSDFLSHGLFMDGLIYSTVSKNLSEGIGTLWNPHFTVTCLPEFHEHPPLALGLQSIFFSVLGEGRLTEKIYSFLTCIMVAFIIVRIWRKLGHKNAWLPLLLWCIIPVVSWACPNNLLENTMAIFITLSLLFYIESLNSKKYLFLVPSGLMLFLGFLTKGFVALFPWSMPLAFWLVIRKTGIMKMVTESMILVLSTLIPLAFLLLIPEAASSLRKYLDIQVISSLKEAVTVDSRFYITVRLVSELIAPLAIVLVLIIYGVRSKSVNKARKEDINYGVLFILIALCGVLPIMISMKQSGFYLIPSLPFFALGFSLLIREQSDFLVGKILTGKRTFRYLLTASGALFITGIFLIYFNVNKFSRDEVKLRDTYAILPSIPSGTTINILPDMFEDWSLHGYYARMKNVSLDPDLNNRRNFLLIRKAQFNDTTLISSYNKVDTPAQDYQLYVRK